MNGHPPVKSDYAYVLFVIMLCLFAASEIGYLAAMFGVDGRLFVGGWVALFCATLIWLWMDG